MAVLRVGHILPNARIYGPGTRYTIWLQGCSLGCKGCWNKQFWPEDSGKKIGVDEIITEIKLLDVEGITLLGGEPLQQPEAVMELINETKKIGKTVFLYTGYTKNEMSDLMKECAENSDILIAGRYVEKLRDLHLRWRGSSNQIIEFPTGVYGELDLADVRELEVHISGGNIHLYGYPDGEEEIL